MESVQNCSWSFKRILLFSGTLIFAMFIWTWINSPMVVTVFGTGEVSVPAQEATISFSLSSSDTSSAGAVSQVKEKIQAIVNLLKNSGISEEDIFISQLQIIPADVVIQGASGFQAIVSMSTKTVNVISVSNLISNLYANGAAVVSQPVLSTGDQKKLEDQAINEAMKDAKIQATKIALKNWKFIKKIVAVTQATSPSTSTSTSKADVSMEAESQEAAQNGVFKIVKAVSVSYKMW